MIFHINQCGIDLYEYYAQNILKFCGKKYFKNLKKRGLNLRLTLFFNFVSCF